VRASVPLKGAATAPIGGVLAPIRAGEPPIRAAVALMGAEAYPIGAAAALASWEKEI
jgi:hypothetical protein